jgi:hypothetical protein
MLEILTCDKSKRLKLAPTPLHLEAMPIWWYEKINKKMHGLTWPKLSLNWVHPNMKGQFLALGPMSNFNNFFKNNVWFF